jgi:hypothetical protein
MIELLMLLGLMVGTYAVSYDITVWIHDTSWGGDDDG